MRATDGDEIEFDESYDEGELAMAYDDEAEKPRCRLIGEDGNVFSVIGRVAKALKAAGKREEAAAFTAAAFASHSYDAVLALAMTYVEVV